MKTIAIFLLTCAAWAGPKQLFNGKNLDGWARIPRHEGAPADQQPGFKVENGLLVSLPVSLTCQDVRFN